MRLIRITTNHLSYINNFYALRPELKQQTYTVQYQELMADCFGWADFWTHAFRKLGYEVWEPVGNAESMQKVWAQENGISYEEKTWLTDIVTAQINHFQPDIVFVNDYSTYTLEFFRHIRRECPSIKLVMGWCGAPYLDGSIFNAYDVVLSNIPSLVDNFRKNGHRCEYMCHAFEPRVLDKINLKSNQKAAFSFVGSLIKGEGFHNQREELLKYLIQETDLEIWSGARQVSAKEKLLLPLKKQVYNWIKTAKFMPGFNSLITSFPKLNAYANMEKYPDLSQYVAPILASRLQPALFGLSMYQKLYDSLVTLNNHIDIASQFASNMRLYEATGVGTCLLTEWQYNLHEVFEPDVEVVTYRSPAEAVEKVRYLLSNDEARCKIAASGQRRTLQNHTFDLRAQQLDKLIRRIIK